MHGVSAHGKYFEPNVKCFEDKFSVLTVSLRGHGESPKPEPETRESYTVEKMAGDILELLNELEIDSVHYMGHSMGGVIGYEILKSHSERIKSFAVCGSPAEIKIPDWVAAAGTYPLGFLPEKVMNAGAKKLMPYFSAREKETQDFLCREIFPFINWEATRHCLTNLSNISYLDVLANTDKPVLYMHGSNDVHNINMKSTLNLIKDRPGFTYKCFEGAGHNANLDCPEEFNTALEKFLSKFEIKT